MHMCYNLRQGLNFVVNYAYDASIGIAQFTNLGNNVNYYILSVFISSM